MVEDWRVRATAWSEGATLRIGGSHLPLPLRARVVLEHDAVALPDGRRGPIAEGSIREMSEVTAAARAKAPERWAFEHFMGSPYQWGGVTPWGVDCSGLVQTTFAARGVILPRDSAQQVFHGDTVSFEAVQPGRSPLLHWRVQQRHHSCRVRRRCGYLDPFDPGVRRDAGRAVAPRHPRRHSEAAAHRGATVGAPMKNGAGLGEGWSSSTSMEPSC